MSEQPKTTYTRPVCRGCWALGNNCRICERCIETRPNVGTPDHIDQPPQSAECAPIRYAGTTNDLKEPVIVECVSGAFVRYSDYAELRALDERQAKNLDDYATEMNRLQAALHNQLQS